jgi:hypothetical protein
MLESVAGQYPDRPFVITEQGTLSTPSWPDGRRVWPAGWLRCSPVQASAMVTIEAFREIDALAALDEIAPGKDQPGGQRALPGPRVIVTVLDPEGEPRRPAAVSPSQVERGADAVPDAELARRAAAV